MTYLKSRKSADECRLGQDKSRQDKTSQDKSRQDKTAKDEVI